MKYISLSIMVAFLMSCHGNESADSKPTDLDHTINRDTLNRSGDNSLKKDTTTIDTLNKK
jgi:hypothetical protein